MKYFFDEWNKIKEKIHRQHLFIFLDYDGTLVNLAATPDRATLPMKTKKLIANLVMLPRCKLALISGRALADIKDKVGIKNIIYSGNHGLEIEGPKIKFTHQSMAEYKGILKEIKEKLKTAFSSIKGVLIEDKGVSLSFHYRLVNKKYIAMVKSIFQETVINYRTQKKIKVKSGKMVLEIRPPIDWDKGDVVLWLLSRQKFMLGEKALLPIYIGDDRTDEDAFAALKNKGLTIFVGEPGVSNADYYLKNIKEVTKLLKLILEEQKARVS